MIRALLTAALLVAIGTAPAWAGQRLIWDTNDSEKSWKHAATGFAIGAGAQGACDEITYRLTGEHQVGACFVIVAALDAAAYFVKERRDSIIYADGKVFEGRDFAEGVGGALGGQTVQVAILKF